MSFSSECKKEICKNELARLDCVRAEIYGILLFSQNFGFDSIRIVTESRAVAHRLDKLFESAFGFGFDIKLNPLNPNAKMTYLINNKQKLEVIGNDYGLSQGSSSRRLNLAGLEDDACKDAFIRGVFLAAGSVSSPEKKYHFELATPYYHLSQALYSLLLEMELRPKQTTRKSNYIIYFKACDEIEEILARIGAPLCAMSLINARIEKDVRNRVNRQVNCDTANLSRTLDAAQSQVKAIKQIESIIGLEVLPESLQETARLRMEFPEDSLTELASKHEPPIGKSGLNHRLRKLVEYANKLRKEGAE